MNATRSGDWSQVLELWRQIGRCSTPTARVIFRTAADERLRNIEQVDLVLEEIGAAELPQLKVYNKIDLIPDVAPRIDRDDAGKPLAVWLSAQSGKGCELLAEAVAELVLKVPFPVIAYRFPCGSEAGGAPAIQMPPKPPLGVVL